MFETLRKASEALQGLRVSIASVERILRTTLENAEQREALSDRIAALEVGYAKWSAEADATLLKADALFKNARNAEERARDKSKKKNGAHEPQVEGEEAIRAAYSELYGVSPDEISLDLPSGPPGIDPAMERTEIETARTLRMRHKFG